MKIKLSQLKQIIREETQRSLSEIAGDPQLFKPGDRVRSKNPRIGPPLYGTGPQGGAASYPKIGELLPNEDAEVVKYDWNNSVLIRKDSGEEAWILLDTELIPATGAPRSAPVGKQFLVTFIGARGGAREKIIVAPDAAAAEAKATAMAKPGEEVEIDEV